jgi:hypothetical protein
MPAGASTGSARTGDNSAQAGTGSAPAAPDPSWRPDATLLLALDEALRLGHVRGARQALERIEQADTHHGPAFAAPLRALLQRFELDALQGAVRKTLEAQDEQGAA